MKQGTWKHRSQGRKSIPPNSWRMLGRKKPKRERSADTLARTLFVCIAEIIKAQLAQKASE